MLTKEKELVNAQKILLQARKSKYAERQAGSALDNNEELAAQVSNENSNVTEYRRKEVSSSEKRVIKTCNCFTRLMMSVVNMLRIAGNHANVGFFIVICHATKNDDTVDCNFQETVLVKERELGEARAKLLALRQVKYGAVSTPEDYMGYGSPSSTLPRSRVERPLNFPSPFN